MAFGDIFGDSTFDIDLDTKDAVSELGRVLKKCSELKLGTAATDAVIQKFMASFGQLANSARYCAKPLETMVKNAEKLRDALKGNGVFSKDVARQLKDSVQAQTLNYTTNQSPLNDLRRMDFLRKAGFDDNEENGLTSTSRMQRIARLTTYVLGLVRAMLSFADKTAKANRELFLLASYAQSSVKDITSMGGALEAYGGTKGQTANFQRSYEVEMAKMRVGQGTGGKFVEASRLWGVDFIPNDFKAQQLAIVKALSDPNRTKTEKIGIANTLQLSKEEALLMSQGVKAYEQEVALQASLHKNAEAAAEASQKYMVASQHLSAQIEDVKNAAMIPILNVLTPLKELAARHPWVAGSVGALGGAMKVGGELLRLKAYWNLAFGGGGGLLGGLLGNGGGSATSTVASTVGKAAGGMGSAIAGAVGAIGTVATGAMNVSVSSGIHRQAVESKQSLWNIENKDLNALNALVSFYTKGGEKPDSKEYLRLKEYMEYLDDGNLDSALEMAKFRELREISINTARLTDFMINRTPKDKGEGESPASSAQVTIEQISINVQSDSANPTDVAQAVHEHLLREMRDVVISLDPGGRV